MAHEFESGFFTKEPAWHMQGIVVADAPDTQQALTLSGLDWDVLRLPLFFKSAATTEDVVFFANDPNEPVFSGLQALVRSTDQAILGHCKSQYRVFQNSAAFEWCSGLVDSGFWTWESAGSLRGGQVCWVLLMHDQVNIVGDLFCRYLLVTWDHTGKGSIIITPTSVRVVCMNTLSAALSRQETCRHNIPHFSNMSQSLEGVGEFYQTMSSLFADQATAFRRMTEIAMADGDLEAYVDQLFPVDDNSSVYAKRDNLFVKEQVLSGSGRGNKSYMHTAYGAFQGVEESVEHYLGGKRIKDRGASILYGNGAKRVQAAFDLALAWNEQPVN